MAVRATVSITPDKAHSEPLVPMVVSRVRAPTISLVSRMRRRFQRSTRGPAGRLATRCGRVPAAPTRPASSAEPVPAAEKGDGGLAEVAQLSGGEGEVAERVHGGLAELAVGLPVRQVGGQVPLGLLDPLPADGVGAAEISGSSDA